MNVIDVEIVVKAGDFTEWRL